MLTSTSEPTLAQKIYMRRAVAERAISVEDEMTLLEAMDL